jgi:hypothetical protein
MLLGKSSQALTEAKLATRLSSIKTVLQTQRFFEAWPLLGRGKGVGLEELTG